MIITYWSQADNEVLQKQENKKCCYSHRHLPGKRRKETYPGKRSGEDMGEDAVMQLLLHPSGDGKATELFLPTE